MRQWTRKRSRGQTTAEYAIIVALVAVSSIAIILIFGNQVRSLFSAASRKMASDGSTTITATDQTGNAENVVPGKLNSFQ